MCDFHCRHQTRLLVQEGGDASTRYLASVQDEDMAALKNTSGWDPLPAGKAARGRDNYSLLGVLRTKPGRADSLPTKSMSCSDKIALWNAVGIQGALGTTFFAPLYLSGIVLGGVPLGMRDLLREDCDRAFHGRLGSVASALRSPVARGDIPIRSPRSSRWLRCPSTSAILHICAFRIREIERHAEVVC
jgi:hypothetical protein